MNNHNGSCPCGSDKTMTSCCGRYLSGEQAAATAEQLMRSRYTAYVLRDESYLRKTWHPDTCPVFIDLDSETHWLGLKIKMTQAGGENDEQGLVEFVARYKVAGRGHRLHESSRFIRCDRRWLYVDGN